MVRKKITKKMINKIMKQFDWDTAVDLYNYMNWNWAGVEGAPTVKDLRKTARELLEDLQKDSNIDSSETGGLRAVRHDYEEAKLKLEFIPLHAEIFLSEK